MSIEDLYSSIGSDYEEVFSRLPSKQLIEKFIVRFIDDKSFERLNEASFPFRRRLCTALTCSSLRTACAAEH